jgi:hypothetical protein
MGGKSSSKSVSQSTTTNVVDSYNRTLEQVTSVSNSGNINIGAMGGDAGGMLSSDTLTMGGVIVGAVVAVYLFAKGGR